MPEPVQCPSSRCLHRKLFDKHFDREEWEEYRREDEFSFARLGPGSVLAWSEYDRERISKGAFGPGAFGPGAFGLGS